MIKIFILDDEEAACNVLQVLIHKHIPMEKEVRYATHPVQALEEMKAFQPTLLMLDIEMPHMNGFDVLNHLGTWDFDVIFTTAYDQYAIKAIRFSALDYLLKPIDILDLTNAIHRHIVKQQFPQARQSQQEQIQNLFGNLAHPDPSQFKLALATMEGLSFHPAADIIRCEGINNYSMFYFSDGKRLMVSRTLKDFEELLSDQGFFRAHKSHLVNTAHIRMIERDSTVVMTDGSSITVSRRRKDDLKQMLLQQNRKG